MITEAEIHFMNTAKWNLYHHSNVGNVDKLVRYVVGATLIGSILVVTPAQFGLISLLPLIAIPIVISAIIGWDPIYALFHKPPAPRIFSLEKAPVAECNPRDRPSPVDREAA